MKRFALASLGIAAIGLGTAAHTQVNAARPAPTTVVLPRPADAPRATGQSVSVPPVASHQAGAPSLEAQGALVRQYCAVCHNERTKAGGLSLAAFAPGEVELHADVAEKMIRKLRAGMMPPAGARRPEAATLTAFAEAMEVRIDQAAARQPNPGRRSFQRLNRAEYARSVHDLLGLDVDVNAFLPPDTISHGFDNIADVQLFSATLLEGYLRAAARVSYLAIGDPAATPTEATYKVPRTASQHRHVDGTPFGTRGGLSVIHTFPADGEYTFRMMLHSIPTGQLYGSTVRGEQIEVSINGERVAILDINPRMSESDPNGMNIVTLPVFVKAGPQRVSAAFIQRFEGPVDDLIAPIEYTLADTQIGSAVGVTMLPHLRDLAISGPHRVTGVSDTPSRRRVFVCRPLTAADEMPCADRIIRRIATEAYRRPLTPADVAGLMSFYEAGAKNRDFEGGIRMALQAILASPHFLFRLEEAPAGVKAGQIYRISDLDLASRLSYFLWATSPDQELVTVARQGTLRNPQVVEKQVRRMLRDPRSESLATRFAGLWLRLQDLEKIHPDALLYPQWDQTLVAAMQRETELFFDNLLREDRSVLELLTADYTFVNERLAKHYGIPAVSGSAFRRVAIPDANRRGVLGHASILTQTSVADRTSPVNRGKWVMEVLLGTPPPPPPPNVPDLSETKTARGGKLLSVRERMEEHRSNPACQSCHRMIDPLGLALENFDVTGAWRIKDNGAPVDPSGTLYDGTKLEGPAGLRQALLRYSESVIRTFTENLMAYALGRRVEYYDMPAVRAIAREAGANQYRLSSFILGVVRSTAFQMSTAEGAGPTEGGASRRDHERTSRR